MPGGGQGCSSMPGVRAAVVSGIPVCQAWRSARAEESPDAFGDGVFGHGWVQHLAECLHGHLTVGERLLEAAGL